MSRRRPAIHRPRGLGGWVPHAYAPFAGDAWARLDQVQELGPDGEGHTGCVNALSWSADGSILLSGSDDKRICIWTADSSEQPKGIQSMGRRPQRRGWLLDDDDDDGDDDDDDEEEEEDGEPNTSNNGSSLPAPSGTFPTNASGYPLTTSAHPLRLQDRIVTGHRANIFSAKFLPNANTPTIVSCAGDCDIRVFEVERLSRHVGAHGGALDGTSGPGVRTLRCHRDRTKRIATENSPHVFMTVSEDGTVRQHDLRRPHSCRDSCPDAVFRLPGIDLYSLSMSESAPHTFAVGGQTNVAYICDRRKLSHQTPSWGPHTLRAGQVDCVRRLGLPQEEWAKVRAGRYVSEQHVSCVKISADHPDEVLCAFATHSTALFNLRDTPEDRGARAPGSGVVRPNDARFRGNPNPNPNPEPVPVPVSGPNQTSNSNANATAHPNRRTRADSSSPGQGRGAPKRRLSDGTSRSRSIGQSGNRLSENEGEEGAAPEKTGPERFLRTPIDSDDDQRELRMEVDDDRQSSGEEIDLTEYLRTRDEASGVNLPDSENGDDSDEGEGENADEDGDEDRDGDIILDSDEDTEDNDDSDSDYYLYHDRRSSTAAFRGIDLLHPQHMYMGARNIDTVKDCNFLGDDSDKVCSGSDDRNWFMWDKHTGRLEGVWRGDNVVVNVMEQHPTLPLIAVSGIDSTVKMFAPTTSKPPYSMILTPDAPRLAARNARRSANNRALRPNREAVAQSIIELLNARVGLTTESGGNGDGVPDCHTQ